MRRYGGDPAIVGRVGDAGWRAGRDHRRHAGVICVSRSARRCLDLPSQVDAAIGFGIWLYDGVARVREGVTVSDVRAELNGLIADMPRAFPGDPIALANCRTNQAGFDTRRTLKDATVGSVARALWILLASVGLVLLVACANVANLFLVRSEARQREIAVRRALGAGRLGIARSFLAESLLLSMAGGAIGLALAWGGRARARRLGPAKLPRLGEVRLDGVAVAYTLRRSASWPPWPFGAFRCGAARHSPLAA